VKTSSPLRYPGGKSALAGLLADTRRLNGLGACGVAEPFAGGAGASLTLLYAEATREIYINDADPAIHDFWWALLERPAEFAKLVSSTRVSMAEWRRQRDLYRSGGRRSRLRRAFAAFYLNRCNRSGIIMNGGPIGGVRQTGNWKLGARFNKADLLVRCAKVAEYRARIVVSGLDGLAFIDSTAPTRPLLFIDPPYYEKGRTLYLNALNASYHGRLAERLRALDDQPWILTYDDCREVRWLYRGWAAIRPFALRYAASERRGGRELMITPKWIRLPSSQASAAITW
jgi:DNA adenine methylase